MGCPQVKVYAHGGDHDPLVRTERPLRLQSERKWVVDGPAKKLDDIKAALPRASAIRVGGGALILDLVNCVGTVALPHVGVVKLVSRKFDEDDFEAMLRDLTELATALPFSAGEVGAGRYEGARAPRDEVLYHAFVYLRYILSQRAPAHARLIPALELVLREPHRIWRTRRREVGIEALTRVDARTLLDLVTRTGTFVDATSLSPSGAALARRLGGHLPDAVSEGKIRSTVDTPENRFVKAFIGHASSIIDRTRSVLAGGRRDIFRTEILRDCDRMEASLQPVVRHSMWKEIGTMTGIPFFSTVLQRRRGYREVLRHFSRIRLAPRIPLGSDEMRDLLEYKDIALLYELWTFFRLADCITRKEGPPVRLGRTASDQFRVYLAEGAALEWAGGIRLAYNQSFSPSDRLARSYSVPLRPDIALWIPNGRSSGLHLFDAKFRVQALGDAGFTGKERNEFERTGETRGTFNPADIHKMHTYRDAIPEARSVWVLYPGGVFRFHDARLGAGSTSTPENLPEALDGVGAIPFVPKREISAQPTQENGEFTGGETSLQTDDRFLTTVLRKLLNRE